MLGAFALGLLIVAGRSAVREPVDDAQVSTRAFDVETPNGGLVFDDVRSVALTRPIYAYSVVPGGTYTGAELRSAIQRDPVVAAHYEQLDQSQLRTETVTSDRYVHVSYRKGDRVFWTKNKVLLRRGETILTDGRTQVRTRCGNCISEQPLLPTSEDEPEVVEFDRPMDAPAPPTAAAPAPDTAIIPPLNGLPGDIALVPPAVPSGAWMPYPLASGQFGSGTSAPLASHRGTSPTGDPTNPVVDVPVPGSSPFPFPGVSLPPIGDTPGSPEQPLVPPDDLVPTVPPGTYNPPGDTPPTWDTPPGEPVAVPEPGTLLLFAGGVALLARRMFVRRP